MNAAATRELSHIKPSDLPSPPQACLRVVKEASNTDGAIDTIGRTIAADPSFTAELLRTVNSPYYSVRTSVSTVPRAITILGWRNLRNLALTFAVREAMKSSPIKGPLFQQFWEHAVRRAVAGKVLAQMTRTGDPEEAFTVGLLLDFGLLALFKIHPAQITRWDELMTSSVESRQALEQELFGASHDQVARLLAARWGFPESLSVPIAHHHDPDADGVPVALRAVARLARTADLVDAVYAAADPGAAIRELTTGLARDHRLAAEAVEEYLGRVSSECENAAAALGLRVPRPPSYEQLLAEANRSLMAIKNQEEERSIQLEQMLNEKAKLAEELERARAQLEQLAYLDPLTGLANRRRFDEVFLTELARSARERRPVSLLVLDIDHFKRVNDTYGHPFGDTVIQAVGLALKRSTRAYDFQARVGGEEMVVLVAGAAEGEARATAERVRAEVEALRLSCVGQAVRVTVSLGGCTWEPSAAPPADRAETAARLFAAADQALYVSKQGGRNRVSWGKLPEATPAAIAKAG